MAEVDRTEDYTPWFDVKMLAYRPEDEPKSPGHSRPQGDGAFTGRGWRASKLQDHRRSLATTFRIEKARTVYRAAEGGLRAAEDLIAGIEAMQQERQAANRKVDPEWEQIRSWLVRNLGPATKLTAGAADRRHKMT